MSKYICDLRHINIDDVSIELSRLKSLLQTIGDGFFGWSAEYAEKNMLLLISQYERFSDLMSISRELVTDLQETVSIVQKNIEDGESK